MRKMFFIWTGVISSPVSTLRVEILRFRIRISGWRAPQTLRTLLNNQFVYCVSIASFGVCSSLH